MKEGLSAPFFEQETRRQSNLVTPVAIDTAIGASATTIYTGKDDRSFLIRALGVVNTTGGNIAMTVTVGGNTWYAATVLANASARIDELEGVLIDPSKTIQVTGNGLRVYGWGLRVFGGDAWTL